MLTVTINIAGAGTQLANGDKSATGHMWFSLDDGSGNPPASYGFAPDSEHEGKPFAPGDVHRNDDTNYQTRDFTKTIELTQAQYDAMKDFGENPALFEFNTAYDGLSNSCIDFTWKAMQRGGLNPTGFEGALWPTWNGDNISDIYDASQGLFHGLGSPFARSLSYGYINPTTNTAFGAARNWFQRRDPLALDLDGDGLETTGITASPTLFDHDGDGIKTGTGWLKGDDAFLALDRNGNGTIDNGSELFGVDTTLASGQKAANGFAALADLDSNHDGQFSNADAQYANVRVWRDLNQNGISEAGELQSLCAAGIASINLSSTASNIALAGGNVQSASGTYSKTNGTTGTVGDFTTGSSGNLDLAQNPFYREFTDNIPLTTAAETLPDMQGSGAVRDLRQAASLSGALASLCTRIGTDFSKATGSASDVRLKVQKAVNDLDWRVAG